MKLLPISLPAFLAHPTPHKHIYKHKHTQKYSQFAGQTLSHMYSLAWYWKRTNFANNLACWISELFFLRRNKFFFCLLACGKDILTYKNLFFWEYWLAHDSKLDEKRLLLLPAPPQKNCWFVVRICFSWKNILMILGKIIAQKMKFSIKDFFSKCDQIQSILRIWSHSL